jgi:hypothetical protein
MAPCRRPHEARSTMATLAAGRLSRSADGAEAHERSPSPGLAPQRPGDARTPTTRAGREGRERRACDADGRSHDGGRGGEARAMGGAVRCGADWGNGRWGGMVVRVQGRVTAGVWWSGLTCIEQRRQRRRKSSGQPRRRRSSCSGLQFAAHRGAALPAAGGPPPGTGEGAGAVVGTTPMAK